MSDELTITGGGTTSVVTDELRAAAAHLDKLTAEASSAASGAIAIDRLVLRGHVENGVGSAVRAEEDIDLACALLRQVEAQSRLLAFSLSAAGTGYTVAETLAEHLFTVAIGEAAALLGTVVPLLGPAAVLGLAGFLLLSPDQRNKILSNPIVVSGIRSAAMGADDAFLARAGIPRPIAMLLGDQGLGIAGIPLVAGALTVVGRTLGLIVETPVRVARVQPLATSGVGTPAGFEDRLARIPEPDALGGAQVIVEKYEMPDGQVRAEVFIAGTVDFNPAAEGEPWDMASNISNSIAPGSGSSNAVVAAMAAAGLDGATPVQFTGYSQGGGTAAQLAASGDFNTHGLVTFGGPTGQVQIPETVNTVIVEHQDDLVAALGGTQANEHAVVVERWATEGQDFIDSELLPGHRLGGYTETARLMDDGSAPKLVSAAETLAGFTAGGTLVSRVAYECDRVSDGR